MQLAEMTIEPVVLEGHGVRLEPLSLRHVEPLCEVGLDPELWSFTTSLVRTTEEMKGYVESALRAQEEETALPFATVDRVSERVVGSTRYGSIDTLNRRVEIGWTWIGKQWQRTHVNTEAKYLMLRHAFEMLNCVRVEFKTDVMNEQSRKALLRLGAKEEGILRKHMMVASGRIRDTIYYSILDTEWPAVKRGIEEKLNARLNVRDDVPRG